MFRGALLGGAGLAGLSLVEAAPSKAASAKTDRTVLQLALVLEHLGAAFYGEAVARGALSGQTLTFAETVHQHELVHVQLVEQTLRSRGGTPKPSPRFDFGSVTSSPHRFRVAASHLEQLCVQALNGAGPLVSKPVLAAAGGLVSVEARHVSWIHSIRDFDDVVGHPFDKAATAAQVKTAARATGSIKSHF